MTAPVAVSPVPVPRVAFVSGSSTTTPTAGAIAGPPFAPAFTVLVTFCVATAEIVNVVPPVMVAPFATVAEVSPLSSTLIATEAPTPALLEPAAAFAAAVAVFSCLFSAITLTAPDPAAMLAPVGTVALVWSLTMLRASEPATPTPSEPAPDFAVALNVCFVSPETLVIVESTCRPFEVAVMTPVVAVLVIST